MLVHDAETGDVIDANSQYVGLLGYERGEATEFDLSDIVPEVGDYTTDEAMARLEAAADGEPQTFEWDNETADGEPAGVAKPPPPRPTSAAVGSFVPPVVAGAHSSVSAYAWLSGPASGRSQSSSICQPSRLAGSASAFRSAVRTSATSTT